MTSVAFPLSPNAFNPSLKARLWWELSAIIVFFCVRQIVLTDASAYPVIPETTQLLVRSICVITTSPFHRTPSPCPETLTQKETVMADNCHHSLQGPYGWLGPNDNRYDNNTKLACQKNSENTTSMLKAIWFKWIVDIACRQYRTVSEQVNTFVCYPLLLAILQYIFNAVFMLKKAFNLISLNVTAV